WRWHRLTARPLGIRVAHHHLIGFVVEAEDVEDLPRPRDLRDHFQHLLGRVHHRAVDVIDEVRGPEIALVLELGDRHARVLVWVDLPEGGAVKTRGGLDPLPGLLNNKAGPWIGASDTS